jgi:hypothetical protein
MVVPAEGAPLPPPETADLLDFAPFLCSPSLAPFVITCFLAAIGVRVDGFLELAAAAEGFLDFGLGAATGVLLDPGSESRY